MKHALNADWKCHLYFIALVFLGYFFKLLLKLFKDGQACQQNILFGAAVSIIPANFQGIPPNCLAKVNNPDIHDIIQGCTRYKKEER